MDKFVFAVLGLIGLYLFLHETGAPQAGIVLTALTGFYLVLTAVLMRD